MTNTRPTMKAGRRAGIAAMLALPAALAGTAGAQPVPVRDDPARHLQWFSERREFPLGRIPEGAWREAVRHFQARAPKRVSGARFSVHAATNGWTSIGPFTIPFLFMASAGRVSAIAVHPTDPATVYATGAQGGVWRTTNSGANWTPLSDHECSLATGALVIDPVDPAILYVGTGELTNSGSSYYGCGVLRTTDGGQTWTQQGAEVFDVSTSNTTGGAFFSRIVIERPSAGSATTTRLWATTSRGVFRSVNSGGTWTQVEIIPGVLGGVYTDVVLDQVNPARIWVARGISSASSDNGVYFSANGGLTWSKQTTGLPASDVGRIRLALAPSNANRLFTAIEKVSDGTLLGIWRTDDGGATWTEAPRGTASCASQCWYDMIIEIDPVDMNRVYFGGLHYYRSAAAGEPFVNRSGDIHVDQHAIAFAPSDPSIIYIGNDGGVYRSSDRGETWTTKNNDIAITQFYPGISLDPTEVNRAIGGTQDNGTDEWSGAPAWNHVLGGDGGFTAINRRHPAITWAETQWIPNQSYIGPRRRDTPTGGFVQRINGIALSDRADFIPPLVMDPVNPDVLFFGTFRLYRTRNAGESWTPLTSDLSRGGGVITAIGVSPADTLMVYVGTSDGNVQVSRDQGAAFTLATGLPTRTVTDFTFDPGDPAVAWVALSGFNSPHVFRTSDRGATWVDVSGDLPNIPVNALAFIGPTGELVAGTDVGIYRTTDGGTTWTPWVGVPNVAVLDIVFNPRTSSLVAATHGRGMFRYQYEQTFTLRGDVNLDDIVGALDAQAVLSHVVGLPLPTGWQAVPNGDANCDGQVTALDAQVILASVVGLPLPAEACVGQWR